MNSRSQPQLKARGEVARRANADLPAHWLTGRRCPTRLLGFEL
ncbi:hypothetical protein BSU04_09680 [Caballeronia sordidicola]|uniref:Uncharacterized protein n=1 Tax=Caballeronia sordidicola TaxID=196367 RepID=A0A226X606_CABSO|nr:hypothetical protein BSU04_09680 [Caballeronia sordidicola]